MRRTRTFLLWLACFYAGWLALVIGGGHLASALANWPIAVAMALGSYVAGSTPLGGGTIGFPVLVLFLDEPAGLGRHFSFAVQSIGMTSASIFIFVTYRPVDWMTVGWGCLGAAIATPLGIILLTPHLNDLVIKLTFAILWASFGLMHLFRIRRFTALSGIDPASPAFERAMGLAIGVIGGGLIAASTGVGIDMLAYVLLVLVRRCDLRTAIPTSVLLMAFTSLVGLVTLAARDSLLRPIDSKSADVFAYWIAAAPIVAIGAPFGAYAVHLIPRGWTLIVLSVLCILQFIWTGIHESLGAAQWLLAVACVLLCNLSFVALDRWGLHRHRKESLQRNSGIA